MNCTYYHLGKLWTILKELSSLPGFLPALVSHLFLALIDFCLFYVGWGGCLDSGISKENEGENVLHIKGKKKKYCNWETNFA